MLNQLVIVGRVAKEIEAKDTYTELVLAVPRNLKNEEGVFDTDIIPVRLTDGIAKNAVEYLQQGDLVGVKGRIAKLGDEEMHISAEKITFLSSQKKNNEGEN